MSPARTPGLTWRTAAIVCAALALALALAPAAHASAPGARADSTPAFADWVDGDTGGATGQLLGSGVAIAGPIGPGGSASVFDGSFPLFNSPAFTPALAASDTIYLVGTHDGNRYTVTFSSPVKDPVFDFASLGSAVAFRAGTSVTRVSGDADFVVSGSTVSGIAGGSADSNGTVGLSGVFTSLSFTTTFSFADPSRVDGIYMQVGGSAVPAPPPPPGSAPAPTAQIASSAALTGGTPNVVAASLDGPAKELDWDVNGDGVTDASCPGTQPTLQFRPAVRAGGARAVLPQTLTLRVVAPSGATTLVSKQLPYAAPPAAKGLSDTIAVKVGKVVAANPTYICTKDLLTGAATGTSSRCFANGIWNVACSERPECLVSTIVTVSLRVTGCFRPVAGATGLPSAEQNRVASLISARFGGKPASVEQLLDGVYSTGGVIVNGLTIKPVPGAAIVINKAIDTILSSNARFSVGDIALDKTRPFEWNTAGARRIPVDTFPRLPGVLDGLAGFAVAGDMTVTLDGGAGPDAHAEVATRLTLPIWLGGGQANVVARVGANGKFQLDGLKIGPLNYTLGGALSISDLQITYGAGIWQGQLRLCVAGETVCIDARPVAGVVPQGGVTVGPGDAFRVYANVQFPSPGLALATDVYLNSIGAGLAYPPLRFLGGAQITAASIYQLNGQMVFSFASPEHPYTLEQDRPTLGGDLPPAAYSRVRSAFTLAATADGFLKVPVIGTTVKLGHAYFVYEAPGLVSFGGGLDADFAGVLRIRGITSGDFNLPNGKFNLHGHVDSCIADIPLLGDLCWGSVADVSDRGAGGCVDLGLVSVGGGVVFPHDVSLWPLDGCRWSDFADFDVAARAARADSPLPVHIAPGDRSRVIELRGTDGAPRVHVTTADGQTLDSSDGPGFTHNAEIRILRSESLKLTVVGLIDPKPGTATIATLEGSPVVDRVRTATDQPKAQIAAKLSASSTAGRRTLGYTIGARRDQRVTFYDVGAGSSRKLGVATGLHGQLTFTPIPGSGARRIEARFELAGLPAERITVARLIAPPTRLATTSGVHARRSGATLRVTWRPVAQATRYEVIAALTIGGRRRVVVSGTHALVRGVPRWSTGKVRVRALAPMRSGKAGAARFIADGPRPVGRLRPFKRAR